MLAKTDGQTPQPLSQRDKRLLTCVVIFGFGYLVYLTTFSRGPIVYSFEEYERAKAACKGNTPKTCESNFLKNWRKAHRDAPSGSKP
jgi:hypothetical protein